MCKGWEGEGGGKNRERHGWVGGGRVVQGGSLGRGERDTRCHEGTVKDRRTLYPAAHPVAHSLKQGLL